MGTSEERASRLFPPYRRHSVVSLSLRTLVPPGSLHHVGLRLSLFTLTLHSVTSRRNGGEVTRDGGKLVTGTHLSCPSLTFFLHHLGPVSRFLHSSTSPYVHPRPRFTPPPAAPKEGTVNRTRMDEEKMGSEARWNTVRRELKDRSSRVHVTSLPPYAPLSSSLRSAWSSFPRSLRFPRHLLPVAAFGASFRGEWRVMEGRGNDKRRPDTAAVRLGKVLR